MIVGSGIDVIEIARIERAVARQGERFLRRVYAPSEIAACSAVRRSGPHLAIRFAAKEAVMKAVGTGFGRGVRWVDIETVPAIGEGAGRLSTCLRLKLHGRVAELTAEMGAHEPHLAVSRTRTHALAFVLLEGSSP